MQRAIIEVRHGPMKGQKAAIAPGGRLRVGRVDRADLAIPGDAQMSALHFEVRWDGAVLRLRDLGSARGTLVGGEPVAEAELENGAWIRAGGTDLMAYLEAATPPDGEDEDEIDPDAPDAPFDAPFRRQLAARAAEQRAYCRRVAKDRLRRAPGPLYAVLDAARSARILVLLRESVAPYRSLYEGLEGESLADVAPYLVRLSPIEVDGGDGGLLERLVDEGWGKRWGIFLSCPLPFREVRRHLRRFLMVEEDETGDRLYFRFYDPGVLRAFVPTCTPLQKGDLFGEIREIFMESEDLDVLRHARPGGKPC
ncbi:DUF4123 domain-containing protein [Sorangium sp. So ce406]|uniref:DUF4123 domain-containing protein n=1 Tax=Sorangium sp. So ce406 TaxID=3133311 RepID=UPI003F5C3C88